MNDPSKLFKILAKYQTKNINDKTPASYAADNFTDIFSSDKNTYLEIIKAAESISLNSKNPVADLNIFIQGIVLSQPYNQKEFLNQVNLAAENTFADIGKTINNWLSEQFEMTHPDLFAKLNNFRYINTNTPFKIESSKKPLEIKKIVEQTSACINDDPLIFFEQIVDDPGTIYLLAVQRDQILTYENMPKTTPNLGYIRLYAYHNTHKKEKLLAVDNIWINNSNKDLICSMMSSLSEIANYLDISIIDKVMSTNFILRQGKILDVYSQPENLFKLGHTPLITRYTKPKIAHDDDGFYIIKNICKD
ncbi:MAG: hypothetical protein ACP5N3_05235 [Candidatus Nanoarchaeia archaeon]